MKWPFVILYFFGMVAEIVIRLPYDRKRRAIPKTDQRVTVAEQIILGCLSLTLFLLPLIYALTSWLDFANYNLSSTASLVAGALGVFVMAATLWLFSRAHRDLGTNWSPSLEINAQQTLITHGVYGVIRHPMYTTQLMWTVAQALLIQNWIAGLAALLPTVLLLFVRVPREEKMMLDHFGEQYRAYLQCTGGVLPRLRS